MEADVVLVSASTEFPAVSVGVLHVGDVTSSPASTSGLPLVPPGRECAADGPLAPGLSSARGLDGDAEPPGAARELLLVPGLPRGDTSPGVALLLLTSGLPSSEPAPKP